MTPVLKVAGGQPVWTRDSIIEYLRDYIALYGEVELVAAAFSPSSAKWNDRQDLVERYYAGNPRKDGHAWPSLNSIKGIVPNKSFNEVRALLGLAASKRGPRRAAGKHGPVRDVRERVRTRVVERFADARWGAHAAEGPKTAKVERVLVPSPGDERLRKAATKAEQRLATATERLREAREKARTAREERTAANRKVKSLAGQLATARSIVNELRSRVNELGRELHASQVAHTKDTENLAAMLMREETSHSVTKDDRDEQRGYVAAMEVTIESLRERLELADPVELSRAQAEVATARERVATANAEKRKAQSRADAEMRQRRVAVARADKAEGEARRELAQRVRIQKAVAGHDRPLTLAQVESLREKGPQGPVIFMDAVRTVVNAQSKGERATLREALRRVAAAAVGWADRL
jgi:hypothetical protein